jgi:hypothetical protein
MKILTRWFAQAGAMFTLLGVAVGLCILAIMFLSTALCVALIDPIGLPLAAMTTGAVLIAVAGLLVLIVRFSVLRPQRAPEPPPQPDGRVAAAKLGEMFGEEAGAWTGQHPLAAMAAALMAGFIVGSSPKLRVKLKNILE